jgi:hypothetical protein
MQSLPMSGRRQGWIQRVMIDYLAQRVRRLGSSGQVRKLWPVSASRQITVLNSPCRPGRPLCLLIQSGRGSVHCSIVLTALCENRYAAGMGCC